MAQSSIGTVCAQGSTVWVLMRRRNSSFSRSIALVVRADFHCDGSSRVKVNRRSPASSRLSAKVDVGPYDAAAHVCNQTVGCADPKKSDFPSAEVLTAVTTDFAAREPEVVDLMSKLSFTNAQMGALLAWQEDNKASIDEAVVHFITTSPEVWGAWVSDEAKAKLSAFAQ